MPSIQDDIGFVEQAVRAEVEYHDAPASVGDVAASYQYQNGIDVDVGDVLNALKADPSLIYIRSDVPTETDWNAGWVHKGQLDRFSDVDYVERDFA